jgi:hypothetical protein
MNTYKQARQALFQGLRERGWTVITFSTRTMRDLKEPYCDVPGTAYRLWFTTQAVHYGLNRPAARSTFIDIRSMSVEQFVAQVGKWIAE